MLTALKVWDDDCDRMYTLEGRGTQAISRRVMKPAAETD